jgi:hypothetical protein
VLYSALTGFPAIRQFVAPCPISRIAGHARCSAGADAGDTVTVQITRAGEEPETRVPMDLRNALAAAPLAQADVTPIARGLDSLDKLSQATRNAQAPDRESLRHACIWKATSMLLWWYEVAYEKSRNIRRSMASFAELTKSFFVRDRQSRKPRCFEKVVSTPNLGGSKFVTDLISTTIRLQRISTDKRL